MKKSLLLSTTILVSIEICCAQNVGIGTTTPAVPLHLKGTGSLLRLDAPAPSISFYNNSAQYGSISINQADGSMNFFTPFLSGGSVRFSPNNNLNTIFTNTGRVGIGLSNPLYKLDVNGDINLTGALRIDGSAGSPGQVPMSNGSTTSWTTPSLNPSIGFKALLFSHPISRITDTKLMFQRERFDTGNDYNHVTHEFTIPSPGVYFFQTQLSFFNAGLGFYEIYIDTDLNRVNGYLARSFVTASSLPDNRITVAVNHLGQFSTGEKVMVYVFHTATDSQNPAGEESSFFSGFKVF